VDPADHRRLLAWSDGIESGTVQPSPARGQTRLAGTVRSDKEGALQLEGKRIVVTGGAGGMGAAAVAAYAAAGARVASLDIQDEAGRALADSLDRVRYYHCDVASRGEVFAVVAEAVRELGGLDVLANVAGIERRAAAEDVSEEEWDAVFAVNAKGTLFTNQAAFVHLRDRGGRIINFGSDAALHAYPLGPHYAASKGAVDSWTRTAAFSWGRYGITVNALHPAIWTPMYQDFRDRMTEEEQRAHDAVQAQRIPLRGRLGDPELDFAPLMVFLASDGARFITGQILAVNGGGQMVR
jgi:NAD(P)-dependent dehydrogenase (short-subunit alcohol dehydrogenase family)